MTASKYVYDAVLIKFICRKCLTSFHLVMFIFVFYATAFLSWYGNIVKRILQKTRTSLRKSCTLMQGVEAMHVMRAYCANWKIMPTTAQIPIKQIG